MTGRLSGVPGRRPAPSSSISSSSTPGTTSARSRISSRRRAGGRRGVPAALLHRRAEHVAAVAARDEVALARADRARDEVLARGVAQAQDLALDRPHRHARRARRSSAPAATTTWSARACRRELDAGHAPARRRHAAAADLAAGALDRLGQRGDEPARVDGVVAGRRRARAGRSARARARRGAPGSGAGARPRGRARGGSASRRSSSSASSRSRATTSVPVRRSPGRARRPRRARRRRPGSRRRCAARASSSASLAELRLGDRREHAGGDAPGAVLAGVEHDRAQAALGGAPGDGEADDAAADDGDVVVLGLRWRCALPSLRRYYPDQVRRSAARCRPLSPMAGSRNGPPS